MFVIGRQADPGAGPDPAGRGTRPQLKFPADLLQNIAPAYQQAGATISGVESSEFRR